jgi:uncharacterized protein YigE (DUF2233 family)
MIPPRAIPLAVAAAALVLLMVAAIGVRRVSKRNASKRTTTSSAASTPPARARPADAHVRARRLRAGAQSFDAFVVDVGAPRIEIRYVDRNGARLGSLNALRHNVEGDGLELVMGMNAGMYTPARSPVGLLIARGQELAPLDRKPGEGNFYWMPNGVFAIGSDGRSTIEPSDSFASKPPGAVAFATQSGPLLFWNGGVHEAVRSDSAHRNVRNAVGVSEASTVFVISRERVTFYELAQALRELGCERALYLDGGVSRMYAPELERFDGDGDFGPMVAIVRPR